MSGQMPTSVGLTYGQIWANYLAKYGSQLSEQELRRTHIKWINLAAEVGWKTPRKEV